MDYTFILVQKAKGKGGDKFLCVSDTTFSIYVPQTISRIQGKGTDKERVIQKLKINISELIEEGDQML